MTPKEPRGDTRKAKAQAGDPLPIDWVPGATYASGAEAASAPGGAVSLTISHLAESVHRDVGLTRAESAGLVERVLHRMCHALSQGQDVRISGFGSFILRRKGEPAQLAEAKPDALSGSDWLAQRALDALIERVPEIVHARQEKLSQENIDLLVDAYLKSAPTAPARHAIEMDNARERARFVEEFPCYSSRELAALAGHDATNASATATRWKKAGRIFGLPWKGGDLYPAFQFSEGRPRPVIARIIEALPDRMSPWQIAFWLTSSNGWLGGATPLDRLGDEAALLAAAAREGEAPGG